MQQWFLFSCFQDSYLFNKNKKQNTKYILNFNRIEQQKEVLFK